MIKRYVTIAAACIATLCIAGALVGCSSSESYSPEMKSSSTLSASDLVNSGKLTVGVNTNNPPMAGQSSKIIGIDVDVAGAIGDEVGLPVQVVDVGSNAQSALKNGACDVVLGVDSSNTDSEMSKTSIYQSTGIALFSKSQNASIPTKDSKSKIAVQGSSMTSWTMNEEFGSDSIVVEPDLATAFNDLQTGTVDYVAADAVVGKYAAYTAGTDAYIIAIIGKAGGYTAGCLTTKANVKKAIDAAITTITSNGVMDVIDTKWLGSPIDLSSVKAVSAASAASATASPSASPDSSSSPSPSASASASPGSSASPSSSPSPSSED